ncbi:hypothetical protein H6F86_21985 [Phormidium sp. FACHB-592]|uniref:Secreted protein n=1 Tax=Stenomitos frigidus AS-A4 TaxID=2933935 RepID=A0ABV0KF89_9CYAN|nr:hypothetical protein [Phormidium sp. FACHB-592]MBD2076506.1 hypothetical protein [Phormidium sp. FACHB-592]
MLCERALAVGMLRLPVILTQTAIAADACCPNFSRLSLERRYCLQHASASASTGSKHKLLTDIRLDEASFFRRDQAH